MIPLIRLFFLPTFVMPFESPLEIVGIAGIKFIEGFGIDDVNKPHDEIRKS